MLARVEQLERELRTLIEQSGNTLAAYFGEYEDRLEKTKRPPQQPTEKIILENLFKIWDIVLQRRCLMKKLSQVFAVIGVLGGLLALIGRYVGYNTVSLFNIFSPMKAVTVLTIANTFLLLAVIAFLYRKE